jgi:hypothetical protein
MYLANQVDHTRVFVFGGLDDEVSPSPPAAGNLFLLTSQGSAKQTAAALSPFAGVVPKTCGQVCLREHVLSIENTFYL